MCPGFRFTRSLIAHAALLPALLPALLLALGAGLPRAADQAQPTAAAPAGPEQGAPAATVPPAEAGAPVLRLGLVHGQPHLCVGQEAGQRDLWVLRLAYGVALSPAQRVAWPWYLAASGRGISLRADGLWAGPGANAGEAGTLARWLEAVQARVPALRAEPSALRAPPTALRAQPSGLAAAEAGRLPVLAIRGADADPWLASRMNGSAVLPFREELGVGQPCRSWPAGIEFLPDRAATEGGRVRYLLRQRAPQEARPGVHAFVLTGYGSPAALWQDFGAGRIDAALVDSEALKPPPPAGGRLATQPGTQQVILRWHAKLAGGLTPEARRSLSQAINRPALAAVAGPGAFRAARAFLEPVLPEGRLGVAEALGWDSRLARQQWLAGAAAGTGGNPERRLRLAVLSHPLLEAFARRLAGQWQATLGVVAVPELIEADRLVQAWNGGGYDLLLEVADLDDGSLQDLWSSALGSGERGRSEPPTPAQLAAWEQALQRDLPYLPLLASVQVVLARGEGGAEALRWMCPACTPAYEPSSDED